MARDAQERFDVLEKLPRKGCNAKRNGRHCGRLIVYSRAGPLGMRRLCVEHESTYLTHRRILNRILAIPSR
jgi:hypothetical protein